jgi:hypothetical protein
MVTDSFTFIVNGVEIVTDLDQALVLSPTVHQELGADYSIRAFAIEDEDINPGHFELLQKLLSGEGFTFRRDMRRSMITLCRRLGNVDFEQLLFGLTLPLNSSPSGQIAVNLWDLISSRQPLGIDASVFYRYNTDDVAVLDLASLDNVLSNDALRIESEDALVRMIFELGRGYWSLFHHVRFEFLTAKGITDFADHFDYAALNRDIWDHLLVRLRGVRDTSLEARRFSGPRPTSSDVKEPTQPERTTPPARAEASIPPPPERGIPGMPPPPGRVAYAPQPYANVEAGQVRPPAPQPARAPIPPPRTVGIPAPPPIMRQPALPPVPPAVPAESSKCSLRFDSVIISEAPDIFAVIGGAYTSLLYRGSRDGFLGKNFHDACDGHANTLTIVLTTEGWIFGGFSPCAWDCSFAYKQDDSRKSFLFTIKNPHGVPPTIFPLKDDKKQCAIYCFPSRGPIFGGGCDLFISDCCDSNEKSYTKTFGDTYENTTRMDGKTFFTGDRFFTVKELEVFEVFEISE